MDLSFWFMLPVSVVVATVAMASGVEGATFFAPIFMLGLGLPADVAIGTGLITEVFGFASGLWAYWRQGLIDFRLGSMLLLATVPAAIVGTWAGGLFEPNVLKVILGVGLFVLAGSFLRSPSPEEVNRADELIAKTPKPETCLQTASGEEICYTVCDRREGLAVASVGGLFIGMVSTGLGELNGYFLLQRCKVPSQVAVATSVFVVAVTALVASIGHFIHFLDAGSETLNLVQSLVIFTIPGVLVGGQLGPMVARRISQHTLERGLGVLFLGVAVLTLGQVALAG